MSRRSDLGLVETESSASSAAFGKQISSETAGASPYLDPYEAEKAAGGEA
jgi:hypothetical protein